MHSTYLFVMMCVCVCVCVCGGGGKQWTEAGWELKFEKPGSLGLGYRNDHFLEGGGYGNQGNWRRYMNKQWWLRCVMLITDRWLCRLIGVWLGGQSHSIDFLPTYPCPIISLFHSINLNIYINTVCLIHPLGEWYWAYKVLNKESKKSI